MEFRRLTSILDSYYIEAMALYTMSFPDHERRDAVSQGQIMNHPAYHFDLLFVDKQFVGEILYWETDTFLYVEHFCIHPRMRFNGYGRQAMQILCQSDKTIILEIDPPEDTVSQQRKAFYEYCGFCENNYLHIHPPYRSSDSGHELTVMSYPESISEEFYQSFLTYLKTVVMA